MIKEKMRGILTSNFKNKAHFVNKLTDEEDFVKQNIFDSFELIKIVLLIEKEFSVTITPGDLSDGKLNSIGQIEQFVISKTSK